MVATVFVALALLTIGSQMVAGSEDSDEEAKNIMSCMAIMTPENIKEQCCETMILSGTEKEKNIQECRNSDNEEWACNNLQCVLDKYGMMDGANVNDKKVAERLDEMDRNNSMVRDMTRQIRKLCMEGKQYDEFPQEDCPAARLISCFYIAAIPECTAWKETDKCKEMAQHATNCKTAMENMKDKK